MNTREAGRTMKEASVKVKGLIEPGPPVVWCAYYADGSQFALFVMEIEALRYAVEHSMAVKAIVLPCEDLLKAANK